MAISSLLMLHFHLLSALILQIFVVIIRIVEGILRNLEVSDTGLTAEQCLYSFLLLGGLINLGFLEGVDLLVEGLDGLVDLARESSAIIHMFLDFNGHLIMSQLVAFELTSDHFNWHERVGRLQDDHEDPSSEVEHIGSVEDILLEDITEE